MRVCVENATGKLIESQSGNDSDKLQTLIDNAVNAGFKVTDVTASVVDAVQYKALLAGIAPPVPDPIDQWDVLSLRISFNHENRLRALEGKTAITVAQFKTAVKALV